MELAVVIPAHNEQKHIANVIKEVQENAKNLNCQIIVVNDGSTDKTCELAQQSGALVLSHKVNLGKGAALKTGCDFAVNEGAKKIIVIDADGQHEAKEIPEFVGMLNDYDIIFGCRKPDPSMPSVLKFGNWFINKSLQVLYKINVSDSQSGYRAFQAKIYGKIRWQATDYLMETEMIINTAKNKLNYGQKEIATIYNDRYKGTTVLDGVKIVANILAWRLMK